VASFVPQVGRCSRPIGYRRSIVFSNTAFARSTAPSAAWSRRLGWLRRGAIVLVVGVLGVACSNDDDEGEPVLDLGVEAVGTCLDFEQAPEATVERLPVVDCNETHTHEIYFVPRVTDEAVYPGFEALEAIAQARCLGAFEEYVGVSPFESELFFSWLLPTLNTWEREDDREIICVIGEGNGGPLPPGSVRNADR
jgi:hypothetical protein